MSPRRKVDEVIDGWSLREPLGHGGNAEVWRAEDSDGKAVALKILFRTNPRSEPYQRFRSEIDILKKLGPYPGVLPVIDARIPARPSKARPAWLAMPLAVLICKALGDQPSLRTVVEAISTIAETLASLAAEHEIYHRDIKPTNLYRFKDSWCVGDFGLVDYPDKASLTLPGRWVGPIHYLAPELLVDPDNADSGPADVYSLAKTLWVLATGQNYPLPGPLLREFPPCQISSYITDERAYLIEALIEKATHPAPEERPSMQDIAEELSAWLEPPPSTLQAVDLSDLQSRISPTIERYKRRKDLQDRCTKHVEQIVERLIEQLHPLAQGLQEVTGLEVSLDQINFGPRGALLNIPEIHARLGLPDCLSFRSVGFCVQSPECVGTSKIHIELHGGVIIELTKDGTLSISGAYALRCGAGNLDTVWLRTQIVECETAREDQALGSILNDLHSELPAAITAFVEELQTWIS